MNGESLLLSELPSAPARRVGMEGRFVGWRGASGKRHLFSAVPADTLRDYRSAVALLAEPTRDGRFLAWAVAEIDAAGRIHSPDGGWPASLPFGAVVFVHFLSETKRERMALIEDVFGLPAEAGFALAA